MNYYRRYVGDYLRDTVRLSLLEHGAYTLLMDYYYADERALPADKDEIYLMVRAMTPADRKAVDKVLSIYFTIEHDGYHQGRIDEELARAHDASEAARKAGEKGAANRWAKPRPPSDDGGSNSGPHDEPHSGGHNGSDGEAMAERMATHAGDPTTNHQPPPSNRQPPTTSRQTAASETSPSEGAGEARTTRLPAQWRPGMELTASTYADNPGWNEDRFERVLADFRDHWRSKGERREDWDAAWRKWVRGEGNGKASGKPANLADKNLAATAGWSPPQ